LAGEFIPMAATALIAIATSIRFTVLILIPNIAFSP
jgi:hypothetical protein